MSLMPLLSGNFNGARTHDLTSVSTNRAVKPVASEQVHFLGICIKRPVVRCAYRNDILLHAIDNVNFCQEVVRNVKADAYHPMYTMSVRYDRI